MKVVKRNGEQQSVHFDKITGRIKKLTAGLNPVYCDPVRVAQKVIEFLKDGISTSEIDELAAQTAASLSTLHPDYNVLAGRIAASNLQKRTHKSFFEVAKTLHEATRKVTGERTPLLSDEVFAIIRDNADALDAAIIHDRDLDFDYFGFQTLVKSYLLRVHGEVVERPQHMWMRVAVGIHREDIHAAIETYNLMSTMAFVHATPTLYNAGLPRSQMSSCFLLTMKEDSIKGIYGSLEQCALISKYAGGIGLSCHDVRAAGSYVAGTNGNSNGLVPMLRVFDATARYVDQGGGKRKGSFAIYLEPWHADIEEFLELKKPNGKEEARARDLFYALWVCDLFMRRVEEDAPWTLFCPKEAPGLADVHSAEFEALYERYEAEGRGRKTMPARQLMKHIVDIQMETGMAYMLFKDACNRKSNQQNLGTIRSSNLCTEIIQYTSPDEVAVCNLASISLPYYVVPAGENGTAPTFDFAKLRKVIRVMVRNLNKVIDHNFYPVPEARYSNLRHRPIGLGVQGLADVFLLMGFSFTSAEARSLDRDIFESMYFAAVEASCELARALGPYDTFIGSPMSKGIFQFDMWGAKPNPALGLDWESLRADVVMYGVRNSLLVAPMPTASTAQIFSNNECFEPFTAHIYTRTVLAGEFLVVNRHLIRELLEAGLWSEDMRQRIIAGRGSVQHITEIPERLREIFRTVWEIKQRDILDMAAARAPFIDQSQSMNIHIKDPTQNMIISLHTHAWRSGLKTGMYYLRAKPKADAIQFTVDKERVAEVASAVALYRATSAESFISADSEGAATPVNGDRDEVCESCSG